MRDRDGIANTLIVSIGLSLVASILVAGTAIGLKPVQESNEARYRQQIILDVAGLWADGADVGALFSRIDVRMVDLATGEYTDAANEGNFDAIAAAKDPDTGVAIPPDADIATLRQRPRFAPVYLVADGERISQVILPIYGSGLWSTMYGFLSVEPDGNTIRGLQFYEHAETPGLGDQIDKPEWRRLWAGKKIFGPDGDPRIEVVRGIADPASADAAFEIDGISGATLTGRGVTNLVRYWTGPHGFGPYLSRLQQEAPGDD